MPKRIAPYEDILGRELARYIRASCFLLRFDYRAPTALMLPSIADREVHSPP
jgi:hypothetical protein